MSYFLAIDAGGTKTSYVLADETRELARVRNGSIKVLRVGADQASESLNAALAELARLAGIDPRTIARTCVGTSGVSVARVADWISHAIAASIGCELLLCGDEEIALDAAFQRGGGVLVLAGTGSNVAGRTAPQQGQPGQITTVGGWGPALDDVGSGFWIGQEALRRAFRALDERRPTIVLDRVRAYWSLNSLAGLIQFANTLPSPDFSLLTETIAACAAEGDPIASEVLERAGCELAGLALLVIARLQEMEGDSFTLPEVAVAGSVLEKITAVHAAMTEELHGAHPGIHIHPGVVDPVLGALWRARHG
jgi:glucosamine kinase